MTAIEKRKNEIPPMYRGIYEKAMSGRSPMSAIRFSCLECMGFARKQITDCNNEICQNHPYRPYQPTPFKLHKPTNKSKNNRCAKGGKFQKTNKSKIGVEKVINIEGLKSNQLRISLKIEPELMEKDNGHNKDS